MTRFIKKALKIESYNKLAKFSICFVLTEKPSSNDINATPTMPKSPEVTTSSFSPEMTLSRLHDYNNLAAYFSSHAAAAAMASSANAASQVRMFQNNFATEVGTMIKFNNNLQISSIVLLLLMQKKIPKSLKIAIALSKM